MRKCLIAATLGLASLLLPSDRAWAQKDLTIVSWGGAYTRSQMLAYVQTFRQLSGEWVEMETYNGGLNEIREQVETANVTWDLVDFILSDLIQGCREGLLEKIDHSILPPGRNGTPAEEDFIDGALTECGIGQTVWSTVVAYDQEQLGGKGPTKLADFFDVKAFPGKRGLRRDPRGLLEWALMADGVAPAEVYATLASAEGQERAFNALEKIRTSIIWWETGAEPVQLLDSKAVVMTSVWNGRMYRPIAEGGKSYRILWDGQVWDIDSWGVPKGSYNRDKALEFIRFATASEQLAEQTKYISYGPARESAMALVGDQVKPLLPTAEGNMANALKSDAAWWAEHQDEMAAKLEAWISKGGRGPWGTAR